jgi:ribonuclease BN (tRNA processing enzyme)
MRTHPSPDFVVTQKPSFFINSKTQSDFVFLNSHLHSIEAIIFTHLRLK